MVKTFTVKYITDNEIVHYSVDHDKAGYDKIESSTPLVRTILEKNIGDVFSIDGKPYFIELISKSNDKFPKKQRVEKTFTDTYWQKENIYFQNNTLEAEKTKLIDILKQHNSLGFLHTTDISNLKQIYKEKYIYSRNKIQEKNIDIKDIANHQVLHNTNESNFNYVRFYLRKNTPANYQFKGNNCILVCDYNIINSDRKMRITNKIATNKTTLLINYVNNLRNIQYINECYNWNLIYEENYIEDKSKREYKGAEFQCYEKVPIEYIKTIIFENELDQILFLFKYPRWNVNTIVEKSYFKKSIGCGNYD